MKKFSRCVLILILVAIISGAAGYVYENKKIMPMYESTTQLYVVPGEENEASIRASNGGLKDDFTIIFKSNVVISAAQKVAGTSEDIAQYLTVSSPANSNIVEIKCVNPDQNTAKKYVDAVASTAIKTTSIIPVKSIQILSEGTSSGVSFKPDLYKKTGIITGIASGICLFIEIIVCLIISAFKSKDDDFNHEYEYERRFGQMDYIDHKPQLIEDNKGNSGDTLVDAAKQGEQDADIHNNVKTGNFNTDSAKPDEEDILEKLEHEVSDYFNEGKEEKKKKKKKAAYKKPVDEEEPDENISDKSDSMDDDTENITEGSVQDDSKTETDDNVEKNAESITEANTEYATESKEDASQDKAAEREESSNQGSTAESDDRVSRENIVEGDDEAGHVNTVENDDKISQETSVNGDDDSVQPVNENIKDNNIKNIKEENTYVQNIQEADEILDSESENVEDALSFVDELSDEELKNVEIEDQAAATMDEEEMVNKVLNESAQAFSADVAQMQEVVRKNYPIIGTIKK